MGTSTQPIETVAIVDLGNDIQLTYSVSGYQYTLNKLQLRVKQTDKWVFITNADGFNNSPDNQVIKLDYKIVSSPSYSDNDELFAGIIGMIGGVSLGGGASAGGGASVWSTKQGDFSAVVTTSTKNITVTGLPWTLEAQNVAIVEKWDLVGDKSTLKISNVTVSGGVITLGDEDDFAAGDVVAVTLIGPDKAYDEGGDQGMQFITNQDSGKWTSSEHLVDLAIDAETNRFVIPMEGFKDLSMHWKFTAGGTVVMTLWATNNPAADDTADADWVDVSADYLTKTLSGTTEQAEVAENIFFQKVMVKIVTTGTTNVADIYIKKKAL
jgi:hypothetical protein